MSKTLIVVAAVLILALTGCRRPQTETAPTAPAPTASSGAIAWLDNLDEALALAKQQNKPVIVDFWATWCGPCKTMEEKTWPDPQVIAAAADYIMVKQDVDKVGEVASKYKIDGVPTLVFLSADGKETRRQVGGVSADELLKLMR